MPALPNRSTDARRSPEVRGNHASAGNEPVVVATGLTKAFDGQERAAVDDVTFSIDAGSAVGLLGPNGAGKTTTIKMLLGLVVPTAGEARVAGIDVQTDPTRVYRHVGAVLEGARNVYWRLTVLENLHFFSALSGSHPRRDRNRHEALLGRFGLADRAHTPVRELSLGMKRKVALASTLARDADVIFLDEPSLGLDVDSSIQLRRELRRLVDEEGITIVVSSHDMRVVEDVCDRVVVMSEGAIVADDTVEDLLDVLQTRTYEVHVDSTMRNELRRELRYRFDAYGFERLAERERFAVAVTAGEFYDLIDLLRDGDCDVAMVDSIDASLEEAFLHVTNGDRGRDE